MDATLSPRSSRRRGSWSGRRWTLAVALLVVGMLAQACSDNNGSTGPTFACQETAVGQGKSGSVNARSLNACTAPVSGVVNDIGDLLITVQANPGSTEPGRRVSIIVIVTNGNAEVGGSGQPLPGQRVFILASAGVVDGPTGTTDIKRHLLDHHAGSVRRRRAHHGERELGRGRVDHGRRDHGHSARSELALLAPGAA